MESNEIQFNQYEGGFWIATHQNVILWVAPNSEEMQFHEVPDLKEGYTFSNLMASTRAEIKIAQNEDGVPIAFFINPDDQLRFALVFDDVERSEWGDIPNIIETIVDVEGDETILPD